MQNFSFSTEKNLEDFLKQKKFKKVFILCGKKSFVKSGAKKMITKYVKDKIVKYYFKQSPFPEINEAKKINLHLKFFAPDLMIAIGGGSVLDYAKVANIILSVENLEKKIINLNYPIKKKITKLLAIPTTFGSGAEVTSSAVIYINKIKHSLESTVIKPDYFFLIPALVINASKKIKSSSGFDAIAQAVESLISKKSNFQSMSFAKKSLDISLKYYLDCLKKPNFENTSAMCFAANLAGKAINISKTTAPHAVSYPFTSIYKISHGHAVSLTIEKFLKFNFINSTKADCNFDLNLRFKKIFSIFNVKNIYELEAFFLYMKKKANLESNFKKIKINSNINFDKILSGVNLQRLRNNPVNLGRKDIKNILMELD